VCDGFDYDVWEYYFDVGSDVVLHWFLSYDGCGILFFEIVVSDFMTSINKIGSGNSSYHFYLNPYGLGINDKVFVCKEKKVCC